MSEEWGDEDEGLLLAALEAAEAQLRSARPQVPPAASAAAALPPQAPPAAEARAPGWACLVCTGSNEASVTHCVCGGARPNPSRAPPPPAPPLAALPPLPQPWAGGGGEGGAAPGASLLADAARLHRGPPLRLAAAVRSDGRVTLSFPNCAALAQLVSQLPGAALERGCLWTLPPASLPLLQRALSTQPASRLAAVWLPSPQVAATAEHLAGGLLGEAEVAALFQAVPASLREQMYEFQRQGVLYALRRGGRALLGDEMGLGKTVQALALMACYRPDWPCLVLCPATLRDTWAEQVQRWLPPGLRPPGGAVRVLDGKAESFQAALAAVGRAGILICPYSLVTKQTELLLAHRFGCVVADESHSLKNPKSKRSECAQPLLKGARRALCLTGTPAVNRPVELFAQLHCLQPRIFRSYTEYVARFCGGGRFYGQGSSNGEELFGLLSSTLMIRRLKAEVLTQLPPKVRQRVTLQLPVNAKVAALTKRLRDTPPPAAGWGAAAGGGAAEQSLMTQLCFETAAMKAEPAAEYLVETLLDGLPPTDKVLYFAHHTAMLAAAARALQRAQVPFIQIDGGTAMGARSGLVERFQHDPAIRVALLSIKAAGTGLTLTAASTVLFGELVWTPGEMQQAEDRAHRIGQECSVAVQFLMTPDTGDDFVWRSLENKARARARVMRLRSRPARSWATWASVWTARRARACARRRGRLRSRARRARRRRRPGRGL